MKPGRRNFIATTLAALTAPAAVAAAPVVVEVWKAPTCGCCKDWIHHLESNGFRVKAHDTGNTAARSRLGMPVRLGSCHTAQVEGYAIEGHVPAREIRRLLSERPSAVGLAGLVRTVLGIDVPRNQPQAAWEAINRQMIEAIAARGVKR